MSVSEPSAKKAKTSWSLPEHRMSLSGCIDKEHQDKMLNDLVDSELHVLSGLGDVAQEMMDSLGVNTVKDLAQWKYGKWAQAIVVLAEIEPEASRPKGSAFNINNALDKEHEDKSLKELLALPVSALQGLSEKANVALKRHHIDTIEKLGKWKYFKWAQAMSDLSSVEQTKSPAQLKREREQRRLS
mmetsp:Transcript_16287/g.28090  ORF Transcript_16287/g.28090 Transcript_16287/m.28090 type:complete len:186 (+) Transcript_16287:755-1312(+)